jgi:hypothetical protein
MSELDFSPGEGAMTVSEGGRPLPPQPSCGRLKGTNNEESSQTQPSCGRLKESNNEEISQTHPSRGRLKERNNEESS